MKILSLYKNINILSIDVATGAVICAAFFAAIFGVKILPQGLVALGLAVWIVYTADHLLDAKKTSGQASTLRHQFHQKHFSVLLIGLVLALLLELFLVFFIRQQVFKSGVVLSIIVVAYILSNRWLKYAKEIAGASLYCSGVLLPAISIKEGLFSSTEIAAIVPFTLIVLINLILFSWMEFDQDRKDNRISLITLTGKKIGSWILYSLFLISLLLLFKFSKHLAKEVTLIYLLMNSALFIIFSFDAFFKAKERFRYAGDAIFLLPLIHFIL